jgi:hypothetical protein
MLIRKSLFLLIVFAFLAVAAGTASAQHWKKLGSRTLDLKNEHDTIVVTDRKGYLARIKLNVSDASVFLRRMVITFANGEKQAFSRSLTLEKGETSSELDLVGRQRNIAQVDLWYESRSLNAKKAKVTLYGMPVE